MRPIRFIPSILGLLAAISLLVGCQEKGPYSTDFDEVGSWGTGATADVEGVVRNGVYDMFVTADSGLFWANADLRLGDGTYELSARAVEGPVDNGYGMMFMMDPETNDFYLFEVSSDGFVWIGRCVGSCADDIVFLVGEGWFESPAVNQGLDQVNHLRVTTNRGTMRFFVNDQPVGEAFDNALVEGDIGLAVETYGLGEVRVLFDSFRFTPANP